MLVNDECRPGIIEVIFVAGMEQKKGNFVIEQSIIQGQSNQSHSRVCDQWQSVPVIIETGRQDPRSKTKDSCKCKNEGVE